MEGVLVVEVVVMAVVEDLEMVKVVDVVEVNNIRLKVKRHIVMMLIEVTDFDCILHLYFI